MLLSSDMLLNLRGGGNVAPSATKAYSPPATKPSSPMSTSQEPNRAMAAVSASVSNKDNDEFDEFDPRGSMQGTK